MWKRWKIFEDFDKLFESFERLDFENLPGETKYFGYEAYVGPDGIPHVKTFGNIADFGKLTKKLPEQLEAPEEEHTKEPYTDVIVDEKAGEVILTAEMPGIGKKDVKLHATEKELEIKAETEQRKYYKKVPLVREIDPEKTHSTYNNGILEIKAPLKGQEEPEGFDLKVE
jgi:HSP20 family protein